MTPRQQERLEIYHQVIRNCDDHEAIISLAGKEAKLLFGFRSAVAAIDCIDYQVNVIKNNRLFLSSEYNLLLLDFSAQVGKCLGDFSRESGNVALQQKTKFFLSQLTVSSRDIRQASIVSLLENLAKYLPALQAYGMNAPIFQALKISVDYYNGLSAWPQVLSQNLEMVEDCFRHVLRTANLLLKDIDGFMDGFAERHHIFYQSYRRIKTYGEINYLL